MPGLVTSQRRTMVLAALALVAMPPSVRAEPGDVHSVLRAATLRDGPGGTEIGTVTTRTPVPLVERSRRDGWIETDRGWVWHELLVPRDGLRIDARPEAPAAAPNVATTPQTPPEHRLQPEASRHDIGAPTRLTPRSRQP